MPEVWMLDPHLGPRPQLTIPRASPHLRRTHPMDDTMQKRVLASSVWIVLLTVFSCCAFGQQQAALPAGDVRPSASGTLPSSLPTGQIGDLLQQGRQFEQQRRWGEALSHYEDALQQFPTDDGLKQRFELSRRHYDVVRRYNDRSFRDALGALSAEEALDLYARVLTKIQTHYVNTPRWKELVECGTNDFEVALREDIFLQHHLPQVRQAAVDDLQHELRRVLQSQAIESRGSAREAVAKAAQTAQRRLGIRQSAVVLEYLCGAANCLDPYSAYLTPEQLKEVYSQIEGNFVGLGIELKAADGSLLIVRVISASPAEQAGMAAGDRILSVDGQQTQNYSTDQAANLLQGEAGSVVELTIVSPNQQPRTLRIRRRRVEVPSIDGVKIVDRHEGIGYLQLTCFQKTTSRDLEAALWQLHREGMKSLIIDLQGNPGGLLVTAVEVADKFIDSGIIVSTRGRNTQEDFTYSAHAAGTWRVPLVLMIDHDSASAAEIFAGAIRDHRRGTIVGTRSYGKGSVQGIFQLEFSTAGIRLTTAKFYSPTGHPYSRVGVEPDVQVHVTARPQDGTFISFAANNQTDPVMDAALQILRAPQQRR